MQELLVNMFYKWLILCCLLRSAKGGDFTLVVDTTESMEEEVLSLRSNMRNVIENLSTDNLENFLLITYDTEIHNKVSTAHPTEFLSHLDSLKASGGLECPERSLSAIEKALEISSSEAHILLVTDASARDPEKLQAVKNLCKTKRSQVMIYLSGHCPHGDVNSYYEIAHFCKGLVVLTKFQMRQAFPLIKEFVNSEWSDVTSYKFSETKQITVSVDRMYSDNVMVAVSGARPQVRIQREDGTAPMIEKVVDSLQCLAFRIVRPEPGQYLVNVRSRGTLSAAVYKKKHLDFQYGFSHLVPRSIRETSLRPLPAYTNNLLISVPSSGDVEFESVEFDYENTQKTETFPFTVQKKETGIYMASMLVAPDEPFKILVKGKDTEGDTVVLTTKVIEAQTPPVFPVSSTSPEVEILQDTHLVDYRSNVTVACKITAYPRPEISWETDSGSVITSESSILELPSVYISYMTIEDISANTTITCKAINKNGENSYSFDLFVNRPFSFDVLQQPNDKSIEYGTEDKLYCQIDAYPPIVETKWYHNETLIEYSGNYEINAQEHYLKIKKMGLSDAGNYVCEVTNDIRTEALTAEISVSGLEMPTVYVDRTQVYVNPGDTATVECRARGNPYPSVKWLFNGKPVEKKGLGGSFFKTSLFDSHKEDNSILKISSVDSQNSGVYTCSAESPIGEVSIEVNLQVQYPPAIRDSESMVSVREFEEVELPCEVDGSPPLSVYWRMSQAGTPVNFDEHHATDEFFTHRFLASEIDSGDYQCIAQNRAGTAQKTVQVVVLVAPYIQPPQSQEMQVRAGDLVVIPCKVIHGNPTPATRWEFRTSESITPLSGNLQDSTLYIQNITYRQHGLYRCIAENEVKTDSIEVKVIVQ